MTIDKRKQKEGTVQDEELSLYKLYNILTSSSSETSFPDIQIIQDEINNLEKVLKILQSLVKIILFTPLVKIVDGGLHFYFSFFHFILFFIFIFPLLFIFRNNSG